MDSPSIDLFVPGRLCLFGEHSDWAGAQRAFNAGIVPGEAVVTGIEQGIYARARKHQNFVIFSEVPGEESLRLECTMVPEQLKQIARDGGYYSYVAGVASYVRENYAVGGLEICITERTLPIKRGLSSSAAICVLVARAFNRLYKLNLSVKGEMQVAYFGEQRTPSRCGRLDQACAFGVRPVHMVFDGNEVDASGITCKTALYFVVADLMAAKDTVKILADLNRGFPYPQTETDRNLHEALGEINHAIVSEAVAYIENGNAPALGLLMTRAQKIFDNKVAPASPEQLEAPVLHSVLDDPRVRELSYGGKGVGSQGDGAVQLLAKDKPCQEKLAKYLKHERNMDAYTLTLPPRYSVTKAVVPVAGYGTRMYPATKVMNKEFFPVVDSEGIAKPAILVLLEELDRAGIEEICLVINGEEDKAQYTRFFNGILSDDMYEKLPKKLKNLEQHIHRLGKKIEYVVQSEKRGFGHAVYQCRSFVGDKPFLLALGDTLYRTKNEKNCTVQLLEAFEKTNAGILSVHRIPPEDSVHYGVLKLAADEQFSEERLMKIQQIVEKPSVEYAKQHLYSAVERDGASLFAVFGEYVLVPEIFEILGRHIEANQTRNGEIQLTDALEDLRSQSGLYAFEVDGTMYDVGIPQAYRRTVFDFSVNR